MKNLSRCTLSLAVACVGAAYSPLASAQPLTAPVLAANRLPCIDVRLTGVQRRVIDKASQGIAPLRRYVDMTRAIHQLDLQDTVEWYVAHRATSAACAKQVAEATKS
jgi:hypothetical protein